MGFIYSDNNSSENNIYDAPPTAGYQQCYNNNNF